jgi:hypothetical protein
MLIPKYILITLLAVFLTFALHEASHWLAGEILGYNMTMTMNTSYPLGVDDFSKEWHGTVISAAGPLFTILQAITIWLILRRRNRPMLYPFLLVPFIMRLFASLISFRNPNDEARVSASLGMPMWVLPLLVTGFLLWLVWDTSRRNSYMLKFQALSITLMVTFISVVIWVG